MSSHRLILFLLTSCLVACTPRSVREAQDVVAQADSLWAAGQMYGREAGDSATLAQAYAALNTPLSTLTPHLSSSYAHACYHYGRLLREKENPVAAMECFINATHSHTRDYHILGRVYSNMGSICHLAGEFPLSYEMFEKSAGMFLKDKDTLSYYFLLNDMAFELASSKSLDSCLFITQNILHSQYSLDNNLMAYCHMSQAEAYLRCSQYDSAIYYARLSKSYHSGLSAVDIQLAQAFYSLSIKDSAVYYANLVVTQSNDPFLINNALYILTNFDESKDKDEIRETASDRADTQKILEIRQGKLSQAALLLEQDITHQPDWRWLYVVIITIFIIGSSLLWYIRRKRNQRMLLSQQLDELNKRNDFVKAQHEQIKQEYTEYKDRLLAQIEQNCSVLTQSPVIWQDIHWKDFNAMSQIINDNFGRLVAKLQGIYHLSEKEIRLCVLVLLEVSSSKQLAEMLYYGESGVRNFKNRTAKKLGTNSTEMRNSLLNISISEYSMGRK